MLKRYSVASRGGRRRKKQILAMVNPDAPQLDHGRCKHVRPLRRPLLELWFPADAQFVPAARHRALEVCRRAGVSEDDGFGLDIALGEALANAVVHGAPHAARAGGDQARDICLCIWNFHDRLIIQVHDSGPGFDPPAPPYAMPSAGARETHGRGLPLMEMLTDGLIVCRGDAQEGGTLIYLIKNLVA